MSYDERLFRDLMNIKGDEYAKLAYNKIQSTRNVQSLITLELRKII